MTVEKYLTYRGGIQGIVGAGGTLAFVTIHPEGQPTALYRLDADKLVLDADPLPTGGTAIGVAGESLLVAGRDGRIYQAAGTDAPRPLAAAWPAPATALAPLADGRLAALVEARVVIMTIPDGRTAQTLELPEPGTTLAADPAGRWLAAGTARGTVAVFDCEHQPDFVLSDSQRLHEGAVTAILFEPDELRFLSAGADLKLFSTHARGRLEPEDKGRGNNHADVVTAMIWGPGDRLYSCSRDGSIKSWPRVGAVKPATTKDGVGRVVAMALVRVHDRPRLVVACDDHTIRFFPLDASGKFGDSSHRVYDAYARARHELAQDDPTRREEALKSLAGYADTRALELIARQVGEDSDPLLRLLAMELLGASQHPGALTHLENGISVREPSVRTSAFQGLRRRLGESDLRPIDLALKSGHADVGRLAVQALEILAASDDQALARLTGALDSKVAETRLAAVVSLEAASDRQSPESNLGAVGSKHADVRRAALLRLFQRRFLDEPAVQSALRRRLEDDDPEVRRTAFLLSLHTRERLLQVLRARDPDLQRQLTELEGAAPSESVGPAPPAGTGAGAASGAPPAGASKSSGKKKARPAKGAAAAADDPTPTPDPSLADTDLEPVLQATASRALDTCLRGARGLALLGDPRAFGLLLQLSREEDKSARAEVCRAMGALDDLRGVERLRSLLHDPEAEVRDAAFTAMARIHQADPLLAAESGLNASHEDMRRRGLQVLVDQIRKTSTGPSAATESALELLARTLNDSFPAVRAETFKSALNLQAGGPGAAALRFALRSIHADIRREVLTEAMAQLGEPGGWDLLLAFFNDPEPALRGDAFALALKKTKGLEFLEAGLASRYPDLRLRSVEELIKKHTGAAQALLIRALDDEDRGVRLAALESLVDADTLPALARAVASAYADVRLRAARALARHGDPRALEPLLALATTPEPAEPERRSDWLKRTESALEGLGELGDPAALTDLIPALDSPHEAIRKQAARALVWVARPETTDALRQVLPHADPQVRYHAALGLAYLGDASVASLVFSDSAEKVLSTGDQIAAALALGAAGEGRLVVSLDSTSDRARSRVMLLLMLREWKDPEGTAARCLACLSSRSPRLRLTAARALEALAESGSFEPFVVDLVNDRGDQDQPPWKISGPTVDVLAELLVHGAPQLRARTARLLRHLDAQEQAAFDQAWAIHQARFAVELVELRRQGVARRPVPLRTSPAALCAVAFGAYVGLVREQGGSTGRGKGQAQSAGAGTAPSVVRIRQSALSRLRALAGSDPHFAAAARPVFVQAMGDPNQVVRLQAFEQARAVGMGATEMAAEALAAGHTDLGVKGLELLTGGATEAEGAAVLERAMLTRPDDLAIEAAKLLTARRGIVAVSGRALTAVHEPLRRLAVSWLSAEYARAPAAVEALRGALGSRFQAIRESSAFELATHKDSAAFDALVRILAAAGPREQRRVIQALETLGDPRAAAAFLDRIDNDPANTAQADDLLRAVGRMRRPEVADRLLALAAKEPRRREAAFKALLTISGHDQPILDAEDEQPQDRWREKQYPRHDDVLGRLMEQIATQADASFLAILLPSARWAQGRQVDPVLSALVNHSGDSVRQGAVEAIGWRLRKRGGSPEPLRRALAHRDPTTQFLAAEALARAGRGDGLNILLASVDFATDLDIRRHAVLALGELADERALDVVLKLAAEDGHALQEPALEAIGHLGRSSRSDEVFPLLGRLAKGDTAVAWHALSGLRWLNAPAGWQLIRQRAVDPSCPFRGSLLELLSSNDEPATRDLVLRLLAGDADWDVISTAIVAARRLFGQDSLEPDYAALQNDEAATLDQYPEIVARVRDRGDPKRIFELLPKCADDAIAALSTGLLNRPELPVSEARSALASPNLITAGLAAHVLGRAGPLAVEAGPAVEIELASWLRGWRKMISGDDRATAGDGDPVETLTPSVRSLVWAAGRLGVADKSLAEVAEARPDDRAYRPIQRDAVLALAEGTRTGEALAALESAALAGSPDVRAAAAQAIARRDPERAAALAGRLVSDRTGFDRLTLAGTVNVDETLRSAAGQAHHQAVVLPELIKRGHVAALAAVAEDRSLTEATRLGAVEGLAAMGREPAEEVLRRIGVQADDEEEIRKAAWRGLRRSKRARQKAQKTQAEVTS